MTVVTTAGPVPTPTATPMTRTHDVDRPVELTLYLRRAWLLPGLLLLVAAPALVGSLLVAPESYALLWRQPLFFGLGSRVMALAMWLLMFLAAVLVTAGMPSEVRVAVAPRTVERLGTATRAITVLTVASYAVWLTIGAFRGLTPGIVWDVLIGSAGATYRVRQFYLAPVGGVTTWMLLGSLLGPLAVLRHRLTGRSYTRVVGLVVGLALARSVLASERLALLEALIPTVLVLLMTSARAARLAGRPPVVVATYLGAWLGLYVVFASMEYVRSWTNHYQAVYPGSFFQFALERVLGYYATALNNAAMVAQPGGTVSGWLLLGGDFGGDVGLGLGDGPQRAGAAYGSLLAGLSNPEFNNASGLLLAPTVLGPVVGGLLWVVLVVTIGLGLRRAAGGSLLWLLFYSVTAIGVLEVVRLFYFGQSRFVVVVLGLVLVRMIVGPSGVARRAGGRSGTPLRRRSAPPRRRSS